MEHNNNPERPPAEIDVVILGGGIQGLWLLRTMREAGYCAALIDRNHIGGAQTLHSHGFLHQGHAYPHADSLDAFRSAGVKWEGFLAQAGDIHTRSEAFVGFLALANALFWEERWRSAQLPFTKLPRSPDALRYSAIERVYRTNQHSLSPRELIQHLRKAEASAVMRGDVEIVDVPVGARRGYVRLKDKVSVEFRPRAIVLTAGTGNQEFLDKMRIGSLWQGAPVPRNRRSLMLVLRAAQGAPLPRISLLVPDLWLFVVSQQMDDNSPVWLVSSGVDPTDDEQVSAPADLALGIARRLELLLPHVFAPEHRHRILFGAYEGWKAETVTSSRMDDPPETAPQIYVCPDAHVALVWPTKLTFAPVASERVLTVLRDRQILPGNHVVVLPPGLPSPEVGTERWAHMSLLPWRDFLAEIEGRGQRPIDRNAGPTAHPGPGFSPDVDRFSDVRTLLDPWNSWPVEIIYHCDPVQYQPVVATDLGVSGGQSGGSLIKTALERFGGPDYRRVDISNGKHIERTDWDRRKHNNLVLLDSPISRGTERGEYLAIPHNRWMLDLLNELKVRPHISLEILGATAQQRNPMERLFLRLDERGSVATADPLWDLGFLARVPSPYRPGATALLLCGLHAPATHAAAAAISYPRGAATLLKHLQTKGIRGRYFAASFRVERSYRDSRLTEPEWLTAEEIQVPPQRSVYLSYASSDRDSANWFTRLLKEEGFDVMHMGRFKAPEAWRVENANVIPKIGMTIVFWSKAYDASPECKYEYDLSVSRGGSRLVVSLDGERPDGSQQLTLLSSLSSTEWPRELVRTATDWFDSSAKRRSPL
jgi:hypothetical protein